MLISWLRPLYAADGGTGATDDDAPGDVRASDVLQRYGNTAESALRLAEKLADAENANYKLREKNRVLRQERDALTAKQPAEGARVLTADEAQAYDAYLALGKPADLKTALEARTTEGAELAQLKREKLLAKAADAAGYKASVLTQLAGDLDIQVKQSKDGKPLAVVVTNGEETALADYAKAQWEDFLPALAQKTAQAPDINAGARGSEGNGVVLSDEERRHVTARYRHTF